MSLRRSTRYLRRLMAAKEDYILSPYSPHSWWHEQGRQKMVRRLEAKGFPQLWGWLFVTLTIDAERFDSPEMAFRSGSRRIRKMVHELRGRGYEINRYFSKLELHESGWPHWHLGFDCRDYIENGIVEEAWGLGFTKVKRVEKQRDFRYLFKYVVKDAGEIPDWVLDYPKRIRVFQTSVGFYGEQPSRQLGAEASEIQVKPATLRQKFAQWMRRGVIRGRAVSYNGHAVELVATYVEIFIERVQSGGRALDAYHLPLNVSEIVEYTKSWQLQNYPNHPLLRPACPSAPCPMAPT
jgi:hypothetical protein